MDNSEPGTSGARALERALDLFTLILKDGGRTSTVQLAMQLGLPASTTHRMVARFESRGLLIRVGKGLYHAGLDFARLMSQFDSRETLIRIARPILRRFARETSRVTHLGVLEADMVTYLIKEGGRRLFTRETMQLEAYCSAVGKVLLAHLGDMYQEAYLASGPFVALTTRTLVEPSELRAHLSKVLDQGYAIDDGEVADDLYCVAIPLRRGDGTVIAALSSSGNISLDGASIDKLQKQLRRCGNEIELRIIGSSSRALVGVAGQLHQNRLPPVQIRK